MCSRVFGNLALESSFNSFLSLLLILKGSCAFLIHLVNSNAIKFVVIESVWPNYSAAYLLCTSKTDIFQQYHGEILPGLAAYDTSSFFFVYNTENKLEFLLSAKRCSHFLQNPKIMFSACSNIKWMSYC